MTAGNPAVNNRLFSPEYAPKPQAGSLIRAYSLIHIGSVGLFSYYAIFNGIPSISNRRPSQPICASKQQPSIISPFANRWRRGLLIPVLVQAQRCVPKRVKCITSVGCDDIQGRRRFKTSLQPVQVNSPSSNARNLWATQMSSAEWHA